MKTSVLAHITFVVSWHSKFVVQKKLLLFTMVGIIATANAQWTDNPLMNTLVRKSTDHPMGSATSDGVGGAYIFWRDGNIIRCQHLSSSGYLLWDTSGVPVAEPQASLNWVKSVPDGQGGAIIVWDEASTQRLYAQRINWDGVRMWLPRGVRVNPDTVRYYFGFNIASDGSGGVIAAWRGFRLPFGSTHNVLIQRIDSHGRIAWQSDALELGAIVSGISNDQPSICSDDNGGGFVAWTGSNLEIGGPRIRVQRVSKDGSICWQSGGVAVSDTSTEQYDPVIANDGLGGVVLMWWDRHRYDLYYAQRVNGLGELLWPDRGVLVSQRHFYKDIISDEVGGIIATWSEDNAPFRVHAQRIGANGLPLWSTTGVVVEDSGYAENPLVISDGANGAIILWQSHGGLYAQRVDASGVLSWMTNGVPVSTQLLTLPFPIMVSSNPEGVIVLFNTWIPPVQHEYYAQWLSFRGRLTPEGAQGGIDPSIPNLFQNYPNPFNPRTTISFYSPSRLFVSLKVYDLLGREVSTIVDEELPIGYYPRQWDARGLASGIYFYRLTAGSSVQTRKLVVLR